MADLMTASETDAALGTVYEATVDHHCFRFDPGGAKDVRDATHLLEVVVLDGDAQVIFSDGLNRDGWLYFLPYKG